MLRRVAKFFLRPWRGIAALALLTVAPKCIVCVGAYFGLGTMLGLAGPEICGATTDSGLPWTTLLVVNALIGVTGWLWFWRIKRLGLQAEG